MNSLVARMTGIKENVPVPVAAKRSANPREQDRDERRSRQLRTAAAIIGVREAEGQAIIPDDAEEIEATVGTTGLKIKDQSAPQEPEKEPGVPTDQAETDEPEEVITPKDILVAPDVTPELFTPIDSSEVPEPKGAEKKPEPAPAPPKPEPQPETRPTIDPLEVLLGRRTTSRPADTVPPETPVSVESIQSTVNVSLGVSAAPGDLLGRGVPMPDPTPGQPSKIVEAFRDYVR